MHATDVLLDAFGRISSDVHRAVDGLDADALALRLDADANPVAWLVWHLTRVIDDHVADLDDAPQVWTAQGWADRFALPLDHASIGYGHTSEQVAAVAAAGADVRLLLGYHDAVAGYVAGYLGRIGDDDLDEVIDERGDPPVTRGVRLVSVVDDGCQHAGQAAFVAGIARRR